MSRTEQTRTWKGKAAADELSTGREAEEDEESELIPASSGKTGAGRCCGVGLRGRGVLREKM